MNWKENYKEKIKEFIIISHFFSYIFCVMSAIVYIDFKMNYSNTFIFLFVLILFFILGILFLEKLFLCCKDKFNTNIYTYIFNLILLLSISYIFYIADDYKILIEVLFILPIITVAVSHGRVPAIILAVIEGIYIIIINFDFVLMNNFLDINIIFIGILLLTAWLIGSFFELEEKTKAKLEKMADLDNLTDLYNHRYFQDKLNNEIKKEKVNLSIILINIDNFKSYNDMLGHQAGDEVIKKISKIILNLVPDKDKHTVSRYAGDGFALIFTDENLNLTYELSEKIRKEIEETEFAGEDHLPNKKITVSIGAANYPHNVNNPEEILKAADESLYRAKYSNKNNVKLYYSVLEEIKSELDKDEGELISSLRTLLNIINAKDRYTYGHSERVMKYALEVAEALNLDDENKRLLKYGAFLHDIGKIEIDREILTKPVKLTKAEFDIIKNHPVYGAAIVQPIKSLYGCVDFILYHHENIDGSGYPEGIKGDMIPLGAKILRVVDSFDAMVTDRPYKKGISFEDASTELRKKADIYYDKKVVNVFIDILENEN